MSSSHQIGYSIKELIRRFVGEYLRNKPIDSFLIDIYIDFPMLGEDVLFQPAVWGLAELLEESNVVSPHSPQMANDFSMSTSCGLG